MKGAGLFYSEVQKIENFNLGAVVFLKSYF